MIDSYFQLSRKSSYAVRALFELALQGPAATVNVRALAKSQDIPVRFLEVILNELKQGGFVLSVRGKHGGYRLARGADQITVGQIIRFLDNTSESPAPPHEHPHPGEFIFKRLLDQVNQQISSLCENATLEKMVTEYKDRQEYIPNYMI